MAVVNGQLAPQDFAAEIARLRHEDADLKAESECLGKASDIDAAEQQHRNGLVLMAAAKTN